MLLHILQIDITANSHFLALFEAKPVKLSNYTIGKREPVVVYMPCGTSTIQNAS